MEQAEIKSFSCGRMNKQTCCKPVLVKLINPIVQIICFVSYPTPPPPLPPPHHHQCHPLGAIFPPQCSLLPLPIVFLLLFKHTAWLLALTGVQSQHDVTERSSFDCALPPTPGCGGRDAPALSGWVTGSRAGASDKEARRKCPRIKRDSSRIKPKEMTSTSFCFSRYHTCGTKLNVVTSQFKIRLNDKRAVKIFIESKS